MTISPRIEQFEALWIGTDSSITPTQRIQKARQLIAACLHDMQPEPGKGSVPIGEAFRLTERVLSHLQRDTLRETSILCIRALSLPGVFPSNDEEPEIERRLLALLEKAIPDILERQISDKKAQTFVKRRKLEATHSEMVSELKMLSNLPSTPDGFISSRQEVLKTVNSKHLVSYLSPFGIKSINFNIKAIYDAIDSLRTTIDHDFWSRLEIARGLIEDQRNWVTDNRTFLSNDYYKPFLDTALAALSGIDAESRKRFICSIRHRNADDFYIEKRMPLHDSSRLINIQIPLFNEGPGIATGVSVQITSDQQPVVWGSVATNIGDIRPGDFAFTIETMVERPISELVIKFTISWGNHADAERRNRTLIARVRAQAQDINWRDLERQEPYSTSVAEGKEFVGRREKLASLSGRITKNRMQSSYITGQKRIGKSSLAHAVADGISQAPEGKHIHFHYLEYGEYAHTDPAETLASLGFSIDNFLANYLAGTHVRNTRDSYRGTLSPLSALSEKLLRASPESKFVVILDEFDELPQEVYRMGPLAETFFANLRTLSAKRNLAFMLVGGESMPYIVSAQGDQLNKFVREGLDSFSRSEEWDDFVELVRRPVSGQLTWHETAINQVFELSNGHPYYAKLLCAKVFLISVSERDTEITADEIRRAYRMLISSLDVNAFAHLWKDGIQGTREESVVIELQRCRVLVAMARLLRQGKQLTVENVDQAKNSTNLHKYSIEPHIADFSRRGILEDKGGFYEFTLPMFKDWLTQTGLNKLIADTLGDDLAENLQASEDQAFVSDPEIEAVIQTWGSYRSMRIGVPDVRQWLNQVPKFRQQRLLFKLLKNIRFFSEFEIREKLRLAHSLVLKAVPEFVRRSPADRRTDIVVTYVDGPAKSGSDYASRYAEENIISSDSVIDMGGFASALSAHEERNNITVNGVVVVDDFIGTGKSLSDNIKRFVATNRQILTDRSANVTVVVLCATKNGERQLRDTLVHITAETGVKVDLRVCEPLLDKHFAFSDKGSIWDSVDEQSEARSLCLELGARLQKNTPLGFDGQGLLVVFHNTVPNNTLPIIHDSKSGKDGWRALFVRPKN